MPRRNRKASDIKNLDSKEATNGGNLGIELPMTNFCLSCHAWKGELGLEPTIELYIGHLILIFNEVKRVLKKTGTCWVNIGDSYNANTGKGYPGTGQINMPFESRNTKMPQPNGISAKSLCAIPERFMLAMMDNSWIARNDIIWYKSNPMPESVKDRFTGTYEHLYFFVKNKKYWFEQQFEKAEYPFEGKWSQTDNKDYQDNQGMAARKLHEFVNNGTRNKRDVWEINTEPYPEAHFATYPEKLCETPILSGCPSKICTTTCTKCEKSGVIDNRCPDRESPGTVLDPFAGSGTTLLVAKRLNRKSIGIELNESYCKLAQQRISKVTLPMGLGL